MTDHFLLAPIFGSLNNWKKKQEVLDVCVLNLHAVRENQNAGKKLFLNAGSQRRFSCNPLSKQGL